MEEYNRYDALADTMKIEDITSDKTNAKILRQLKSNDPSFKTMWMYNRQEDNYREDDYDYSPSSDEEFSWLGYFLGKNTHVREMGIGFSDSHGRFELNEMKRFSGGLNRNKFIHKISFMRIDLGDGEFLKMLDPFFKNNHNLAEISVDGCEFRAGSARVLSVILGGCNKSLKRIHLEEMGEGLVVDVVVALSMHPQLEKLELSNMNIGRNECMAIATLLRWTTTKLHTLALSSNQIDDDGVDTLVDALASSDLLHTLNLSHNNISDNGVNALMRALAHGKLRILELSDNQSITVRGWQSIASLLGKGHSNLEELYLGNSIDDEGALVFANAMVDNRRLKTLDVNCSSITAQGWSAFSNVLCDTSSVNKTFLSNHTLQRIGRYRSTNLRWLPQVVKSYLELNGSSEDKKKIAMKKILQHHSDFNMKPLFEWEFKALPLVIGWCERASACTTAFESKIGRVKLSSIYQFVREMPVMYVEARTRQELEAIRAMKMRLQWEQLELASKLEEVERREARAMGRL